MYADHIYSRLKGLVVARGEVTDPAAMPPDAYAAWKKNGFTFEKFIVTGELGRGGSSIVHRAWQPGTDRDVAIKIVTGLDPELRARFQQEVRLAGRLSHPGILPVFDSGESAGSLWLAMPFVDGPTLDRIEWTPVDAAQAIADAARAVHAAHEAGVIHRDLKPRNLMRDASGIKVMDFGLARAGGDSTQLSVAGQILGTPQYMAPEQAAGLRADERTDVYGLGATLYRLVTGHSPYEDTSLNAFLQHIATGDPTPPSKHFPGIPAPLDAILSRAMDRDPARRYATAAALADDLERFAQGQPVQARRPSLLRRGKRFLGRHPFPSLVGASVLLIGAIVALGSAADQKGGISGLLSGQPAAEIERDQWRADANRFQVNGDLIAAVDMFSRLLEQAPDDRSILMDRARCFIELRRLNKAEADLTRRLEKVPDDLDFLKMRGRCRLLMKDVPGAKADLDRALVLEPHSAELLMERALVHMARHDLAAAIADANAAVRAAPDNAETWAARARIWDNASRLDQAIADYDAAIRLGGRKVSWLRDRGRMKVGVLDGEGALADLQAAIEMDPAIEPECREFVEAAKRLVDEKKKAQPK